jgi:hypothetical protein
MWDFILRTFQHLAAQVSPQRPFSSPMWLGEVVGRTTLAKQLILDDTGKLDAMNAGMGYSDDADVEFGPEILALAEMLQVPEGCAGCGMSERADGKDLLVCARCKTEKYCSTGCQKKCWKVHKRACTGVA